MKKIVTNPAWMEAPWELRYMAGNVMLNGLGRRTATEPPPEGFKDAKEMLDWFSKNEVPRYITIES